jgi:hypothetical protein
MVCGGANGPQAHLGRSVIEGAVLEVRGRFSDSSSYPHGRSARRLRTILLGFCRAAKSFAS